MARDLSKTYIYHITAIDNLPDIVAAGGLHSDAAMHAANANPSVIGYSNIKQRRLTQTRVPCSGNRFVGQFVPFYYCPRSPMLYSINRGNTGLPVGSQKDIVHLVSTVQLAMNVGRDWAISDGNAGSAYPNFYGNIEALDSLNWPLINDDNWAGRANGKQAEFLVADFFSWSAIIGVACHNDGATQAVNDVLSHSTHKPAVKTVRNWYY